MEFKDKHQVDTDGALMLRVLTDTLWNIDEHHEKINHRATFSADVSSIPSIFGSCRGFMQCLINFFCLNYIFLPTYLLLLKFQYDPKQTINL